MEDTGLADVVARRLHPGAGTTSTASRCSRYADDMRAIPIDIQACFQNVHGSSMRREAMLWQYIPDPHDGAHLLATDLPLERREPGTYMYDALAFRDQWKSRLLRTAAWSPLY